MRKQTVDTLMQFVRNDLNRKLLVTVNDDPADEPCEKI